MTQSEEELKSLLMKVKEESENVGLNLNIQNTKIMASGTISSWQIDGETVQTLAEFIFWGSKITADGDCSHEVKRNFLLGRKILTNLNIYFCYIDYAKTFDCVKHNKVWKILKEMGIPDHLTCLLRNLYAVQEATVRAGHGTIDLFQIEKGVRQGCILSLCIFNFYAEYIMKNAGLEESQAGILAILFKSV